MYCLRPTILCELYSSNQFALSMRMSQQNCDEIHAQRVENEGVLKAKFENADELDGVDVDLHKDVYDEVSYKITF